MMMGESRVSTAYTHGPAHPLAPLMDGHGMLPADWCCLRCGKQLNADGGHPAELYAGTFNGLCYGCTSADHYVARVSLLDGAMMISWPPSCPSWRRDREEHIAYPGCASCKGTGVQGLGSSVGGGTYHEYCRECLARYFSHPVRELDSRWRNQLAQAGDRAFQVRMTRAAGLRPTASAKRQRAAWEALDDDVRAALRAEIQPRYKRLLARHEARIERMLGNAWRQPGAKEAA